MRPSEGPQAPEINLLFSEIETTTIDCFKTGPMPVSIYDFGKVWLLGRRGGSDISLGTPDALRILVSLGTPGCWPPLTPLAPAAPLSLASVGIASCVPPFAAIGLL